MKKNEYDLKLLNFAPLIAILDQFFISKFSFLIDPNERAWKVVLWNEPHGRCVTKRETIDEFLRLRALVFINESIQHPTLLGVLLLLLQL
jgi:hypothetical protein